MVVFDVARVGEYGVEFVLSMGMEGVLEWIFESLFFEGNVQR